MNSFPRYIHVCYEPFDYPFLSLLFLKTPTYPMPQTTWNSLLISHFLSFLHTLSLGLLILLLGLAPYSPLCLLSPWSPITISTLTAQHFSSPPQNVLWTTEPPWRTPFLLYPLFLLVHRRPLFTPQAFISPKLYWGFTSSRNHPHMPNRSCVHLFSTCLYHCPGRYFHNWIQYNFMCLFFTYVMISSSYSKNNLRSLT